MGYRIVYDEENKILETLLDGDISHDEVLSFIDKMVQFTLQNASYLWLVNYTHARYKLRTPEIYDLPQEVFQRMGALGEHKFKIKRAIVKTEDSHNFAFLENVASNKGQNLRIFDDRQDAIRWLVG